MFKRLVSYFTGRHTLFAFLELSMGTLLAWFHHLDMTYVALCGTIQAFVLGHSIKCDVFEKDKNTDGNQGSTPAVGT